MKNFKNIRNENVNKMKLIDKMKKASPAAKKALEAPSRVEDVRSADKKAETYIKPDGKPGFRMVPVNKTVLKKEDLDEGAISTAKSPEEKRRARELRSKIGQHHTDTAKGQRAQTVGTDWKDTKNKERAKMGLPPIHETALNELTAAELKLINQMYDKKGNLTPLGKRVMDHGKAASKLTPKDAAADKARRKEYNAYQKSKRNEEFVGEEKDPNEYDREGEMMKGQLRQICSANEKLMTMVGDDDNLPEWVQNKVTKATDYIRSVRDYLESENGKDSMSEASKSDMLCKECGDQFGKPTNEECMYDAYDQLGENWVTKEMYEGLDITEISLDMLSKKISNTKGRGQMRKAMKTDKVKTDLAKMRDKLNKDKGTKA